VVIVDLVVQMSIPKLSRELVDLVGMPRFENLELEIGFKEKVLLLIKMNLVTLSLLLKMIL